MMGMTYNPLTKRYRLTPNDVSVNYLIRAKSSDITYGKRGAV